MREGKGHAIIVLNGFLSQGNADTAIWERGLGCHFAQAAWYHCDWQASNGVSATIRLMPKSSGVIGSLLGNPWHHAMRRARLAGERLARAILQTQGWQFTLIGHSLGARVIYYALSFLARHEARPIRNVYLLGGAVGAASDAGWSQALRPVKGTLFNCHSRQDRTLQLMYQGANAFLSRPVGLHPIRLKHRKMFNHDCSHLVDSHFQWHKQLPHIIEELASYSGN